MTQVLDAVQMDLVKCFETKMYAESLNFFAHVKEICIASSQITKDEMGASLVLVTAENIIAAGRVNESTPEFASCRFDSLVCNISDGKNVEEPVEAKIDALLVSADFQDSALRVGAKVEHIHLTARSAGISKSLRIVSQWMQVYREMNGILKQITSSGSLSHLQLVHDIVVSMKDMSPFLPSSVVFSPRCRQFVSWQMWIHFREEHRNKRLPSLVGEVYESTESLSSHLDDVLARHASVSHGLNADASHLKQLLFGDQRAKDSKAGVSVLGVTQFDGNMYLGGLIVEFGNSADRLSSLHVGILSFYTRVHCETASDNISVVTTLSVRLVESSIYPDMADALEDISADFAMLKVPQRDESAVGANEEREAIWMRHLRQASFCASIKADIIVVRALVEDLTMKVTIKSSILLVDSKELVKAGGRQLIGSLLIEEVSGIISDASSGSSNFGEDILAALDIFGIKVLASAVHTPFASTNPFWVADLASMIRGIRFRVPKSLLHIYGFIQKWKSRDLDKYQPMLQVLRQPQNADRSATVKHRVRWNGSVKSILLRSETLRSLHLSYEIQDTCVILDMLKDSESTQVASSFHLKKQELMTITMELGEYRVAPQAKANTFTVPAIFARFRTDMERSNPTKVHGNLYLEKIHSTVDVDMVDKFLAAQSVMSSDVNELIDVISKSTRKNQRDASSMTLPPSMQVKVRVHFRGFQLAVAGPTTVLFLESDGINGALEHNAVSIWSVQARNVSISCNHNASVFESRLGQSAREYRFDSRKYRLAYVRTDFNVQNTDPRIDQLHAHEDAVFIVLTDVFSITQPVAIGKMLDIFLYFKRELEMKKMERASEIQDLVDKTKRILVSFDADIPKYREASVGLVRKVAFNVLLDKLSIVIPLTKPSDTSMASSGKTALMLTTRSLSINSNHFTKNRGQVESLRLLFVDSFSSANYQCFDPDYHETRNAINLPALQFGIQSKSERIGVHDFAVSVDAKGFIVDMGGDLVKYAALLSEVWAYSKRRFDQFTNEFQANTNTLVYQNQETAKIAMNIQAEVVCDKGECRLHFPDPISGRTFTALVIPGVTSRNVFQIGRHDTAPSDVNIYHFEVVIHDSENTLTPGIIGFTEDLANGFGSISAPTELASPNGDLDVDTTAMTRIAEASVKARVSFYFRLSQTVLHLSSSPMSHVACTLTWNDGLFLLTNGQMEEDAVFSCTGLILGGGIRIQHAYSPEPCFKASIKNIALNGTLITDARELSKLSIVINIPDVAASLNFRLYQDFLAFKGVWLDAVNVQSAPARTDSSAKPAAELFGSLNVAARLLIDSVDIDIELIQKIGLVRANISKFDVNGSYHPLQQFGSALAIGSINLGSSGRLEGRMDLGRIMGSGVALLSDNQSRAVLTMDSFSSYVMYEHQSLALVEFNALLLEADDYNAELTPNTMNVDVQLGDLSAIMTTRTVPIALMLVSLISKSIEEKALAVSKSLKMIPGAKVASSTLTDVEAAAELENPVSVHPLLQMLFKAAVGAVKFTVYPSRFSDVDCAQAMFQNILVRLMRGPQAGGVEHELKVRFDAISLFKSTNKRIGGSKEKEMLPEQWTERAAKASSTRIAALPFCDMTATSLQVDPHQVRLTFTSNFTGRVEIPLNYALIRYLQELVGMYTEFAKSLELDVERIFQSADRPKLEIAYTVVEPVVFDPKLRYVGEVTPPIEWIGLQRERIPIIVYESLTLNLEMLLRLIESTYLGAYRSHYVIHGSVS